VPRPSLQDIREGDEVKADYDIRGAKYIAESIEAMHPLATGGADAPNKGQGPPGSPPD
jgi:hypothetical protein